MRGAALLLRRAGRACVCVAFACTEEAEAFARSPELAEVVPRPGEYGDHVFPIARVASRPIRFSPRRLSR